jgi:hypothetical protein
MFDPWADEASALPVTLCTSSSIVTGTVRTRRRRISDLLNEEDQDFLVLSDVTVEELGSHGQPTRARHAQVNLDTVLFAVANTSLEPMPEMHSPKATRTALVLIEPFRVAGQIHPGAKPDEVAALLDLTGRFLPVTEAEYWSTGMDVPRSFAPMVAVNRSRALILADPHVVDPWAGLAGPVAGGADEPAALVEPNRAG